MEDISTKFSWVSVRKFVWKKTEMQNVSIKLLKDKIYQTLFVNKCPSFPNDMKQNLVFHDARFCQIIWQILHREKQNKFVKIATSRSSL